jgi:hypothetical protein
MMKQQFNATEELAETRRLKHIGRKRYYHKSRLDKYRAEMVALWKEKASYREIQLWLRKKNHIKVSHTTIMRYLNKLPEVHQEQK